ncbi:hypothetical protein FBU59_005778, partial [Linderina macrospora]
MPILDTLLAAAPEAVKQSLNSDTLEYLANLLGDTDQSDPAAARDAIEPFLLDAGIEDSELDALFEKLSINAPTPAKPVPEPTTTA